MVERYIEEQVELIEVGASLQNRDKSDGYRQWDTRVVFQWSKDAKRPYAGHFAEHIDPFERFRPFPLQKGESALLWTFTKDYGLLDYAAYLPYLVLHAPHTGADNDETEVHLALGT